MNEALPTPRLEIDVTKVRANLKRMQDYATAHGLGLRPHTKTHKSLRLARMQMELGAIGLTAAKVGEAQVMAEAADDLLVAYPSVDSARCYHLATLARNKTIRVAIDSKMAVTALNDAADLAETEVGILIDLDVGYGRTGVQGPEGALRLAQMVDSLPSVRLDGIMIYPGHVSGADERQIAMLEKIDHCTGEVLALWKQRGLEAGIVSSGSTPSAFNSHHVTHATEIRPGTYVYYDMNGVHGGYVGIDDCAARIISTVVSNAVPGQVVVDAGSKTLTSDPCGPAPDSGYGYVVEYPEAKIVRLTEEHGQIDVSQCDHRPCVGDLVSIIPNHVCPCSNLQDVVYWREGEHADAVEEVRVDARGKVF